MLSANKIILPNSSLDQVEKWHREGQKVVFTNGCFDILHLGHVDYLEKARTLGDKLVVGVNTDASIKINKGEARPIVNETSRARVISSLSFVDAVILFDEETPIELIKRVKPHILVKGDDYDIANIVGADFVIENGGSVETIPLVKGYSTTSIIDKIKKL